MQRPTGVTILAVLAAIVGVLALCGALALVGLGSILGGIAGSRLGAGAGILVGSLGVIFGLFTLVIALLELAFAYGAWNLRPWAWMLGIVAQGISVVLGLVRLVDGRGIASGEIIGIVISGLIIYYLRTSEVKRAFGRA